MEPAAVALGMLLGLFAGLIPGIHANTIAEALKELPLEAEFAAFALAGMVGAHAVFELVPAIFLFIPDSSSVVAVLPGHRLLLEGRGRLALNIASFSALAAVVLSALAFPLALAFYPVAYALAKPLVFPMLALLSITLVASEGRRTPAALLIFLFSGLLGVLALETPIVREPLFPAFAGMFACASLLLSARQGGRMPEQEKDGEAGFWEFLPFAALGVLLGLLADLLPAIGSAAQMATLASLFLFLNAEAFLATASAVAVSHVVFAFATTASIGKARIGSIAVIQELIGGGGTAQLPVYAGAAVVAALVAVGLMALLGKEFAGVVSRADARKMNLAIMAYLVAMAWVVSGGTGLLLMATATGVGLLAPLLGVRRTHLMGFLILPTMSYYAGV
ncbi:MAG: tripartite tricarboxylate transporter permease [Candidatus Micrarchaeia archaeon]